MTDILRLLQEDTPLQPTSSASKQGWWFLASVLIGCTICVPVFFMGAQLAGQMVYSHFVIGAMIGGALACFIAIATGIVGQRTGLPTAMLAKIAFGQKGYFLANAAMALTAIGWFGIQTGVFSDAFVKLAEQVWGVSVPKIPVIVIAGLLMSSTAVIGFRGLGKLSYIAMPLLVALLLLPLAMYIWSGQLEGISKFVPTGTSMSLGTLIAVVAGAYSFACTMPDITRFMNSASSTVKGMIANFLFAYPLLLILTGSLAIISGENDFMQIMLNLGFGGLAIVVLFLSTWTTNDTNAYAAALSGNLFLPQYPRWKIAAAAGILGTLAAVFGIFEHFMSWLVFTGNLFAPMAGVYVADYWLNQKRYAETSDIPVFRFGPLFAWLCGFGVGVCTAGKDNMGLALFSVTTIPMLDALITAACVLLIIRKVKNRAG